MICCVPDARSHVFSVVLLLCLGQVMHSVKFYWLDYHYMLSAEAFLRKLDTLLQSPRFASSRRVDYYFLQQT